MDSVGLLPTLQISVTDPEKHGDGVKAYVSFAVITQTDLPSFSEGRIEVRRRYSDFVWLRNQLAVNNPEIIVPPIPPKMSEKFMARFKDEFLEKRRKALELFLNRVSLHPALIASIDLNTFLCAKEWELKTVQSESETSSLSTLAKRISNLKVGKPNPDDPQAEKFERIRKYFDDLQSHLLQIYSQIELTLKKNQELISDYTALAPGFLWLAQSETELSAPLYAVGKAYTDQIIPSIQELIQQQEYGLLQSLHQYVLTCEVALDVIRRRDKILGEYLATQKTIESVRNELLRTQEESNNPGSAANKSALLMIKDKISFEDPQTKIQRLELKLEQEEKVLQGKQKDLERVSGTVVSELERFHKWKTYDFQLLFQDMVQTQIDFHRKVQQAWEGLLPGIQELSLENARRTFWMTSSRKSLLTESQ